MAESKPNVAVTVAIIGLVGTLGAALITNWGKLFGMSPQPPPASDTPSLARDAPPPAREAPQPNRAEVRGATAEPALSLSGTWRDTNNPGTSAQVTQNGESFRFTRHGTLPNGVGFDASGTGTLAGQRYTSSYSARYQTGATSTGDCSGTLSADGARLDMSCNDSMLGTFPVTSVRE